MQAIRKQGSREQRQEDKEAIHIVEPKEGGKSALVFACFQGEQMQHRFGVVPICGKICNKLFVIEERQ